MLAVPLALPLLMPPRDGPGAGHFDLLALDVGQGTAVLVRTREHLLLFDAGPQYSRESDAGQRVLLPLLRARGETRIDTLVLSHRDLDHVGGAARAAEGAAGRRAAQFARSRAPAARPRRGSATRCSAGQSWVWDGVRFDVLRPAAADYDSGLKSNAMSCVLRVAEAGAGGRSVLLTGDIERDQEAALRRRPARGPAQRRADRAAPRQPHLVDRRRSSTPCARHRGVPGRLPQPLRPPGARRCCERYRERGIALRRQPACGAWRWRSRAVLPRVYASVTRRGATGTIAPAW